MAISALLVVGGAVALAVGAFASTRDRVISPGRRDARGPHLRPRRRGHRHRRRRAREGVEIQRSERSSFGHSPSPNAGARRVFGVRSRCPTSLLGPCRSSTASSSPTTSRSTSAPAAATSSFRGYRGTARVHDGGGAIEVAATAATRSTPAPARAHRLRRRLRAAADVAALRQRRDPRGDAARPLRPRRREHAGNERVRGVDAPSDAPYTVQVAEHLRRRHGGGPVVIAALELDRRLARAGHAVAYLCRRAGDAARAAGGAAARARRRAQRGRDRAAAAARRGAACRWLVRLDRRAANRWLDAQVPPIPGRVRGTGGGVPAVAGPALRPRRCGGWRRT